MDAVPEELVTGGMLRQERHEVLDRSVGKLPGLVFDGLLHLVW